MLTGLHTSFPFPKRHQVPPVDHGCLDELCGAKLSSSSTDVSVSQEKCAAQFLTQLPSSCFEEPSVARPPRRGAAPPGQAIPVGVRGQPENTWLFVALPSVPRRKVKVPTDRPHCRKSSCSGHADTCASVRAPVRHILFSRPVLLYRERLTDKSSMRGAAFSRP